MKFIPFISIERSYLLILNVTLFVALLFVALLIVGCDSNVKEVHTDSVSTGTTNSESSHTQSPTPTNPTPTKTEVSEQEKNTQVDSDTVESTGVQSQDSEPITQDKQEFELPDISTDKKLTPEEEARLDEAIKKAQEFNEAEMQEPELTPEQEKELQEKQRQANSSRGHSKEFLDIASETDHKTLEEKAIENGTVGVDGDYPDEVLDPKSPKYDWRVAVKAKPLPVNLGEPLVDNIDDLVRLHPKQNIWFDKKNKVAVLHGAVGLTQGPLELFACTGRVTRDRSFKERIYPEGPKAHESVLVFDIIPHLMHAALLAAGAEPGKPAVFSPEFIAPSGTAIEVIVRWKDENGKIQQTHAGDWVLDEQTHKTMTTDFVFTGSMFVVNRDGKRMYMGDNDGELICVSNFPSAVMDIPMESSGSNDSRLFIANEAKIPPCGTPVTMILKPTEKMYGNLESKPETNQESETDSSSK